MTPTETKWLRVNRSNPCPVCGKVDWCLIATDNTAAICPRTESPNRCGDAGWLHRLADTSLASTPRCLPVTIRPEPPNLASLANQYRRAATHEQLKALAATLHLSIESLSAFRVGWATDRHAWSFPMTNPVTTGVTNIRFRTPDGFKFGVKGGKESLFVPESIYTDFDELLVCEGATDAIAVHGVGYPFVIGRPSCNGGTAYLVALVRLHQPKRVVILRDNDGPGIRGAEALASVLALHCPDVRLIAPPEGTKDVRDWIVSGATRANFEDLILAAQPRRLNLSITMKGKR